MGKPLVSVWTNMNLIPTPGKPTRQQRRLAERREAKRRKHEEYLRRRGL